VKYSESYSKAGVENLLEWGTTEGKKSRGIRCREKKKKPGREKSSHNQRKGKKKEVKEEGADELFNYFKASFGNG